MKYESKAANIAESLLVKSNDDPLYVAEKASNGRLAVDEFQDWDNETSYFKFADGSCVRVTSTEAEEISEEAFNGLTS